MSAEVAKKAEAAGELSLVGPLAFWIGFLIIAMILDIAAAYAAQYDFGLVSYLAKTANSIIYMPGAIVLPLVASLWMGVRVGRVSNKPRTVLYAGLVNALYALIVYIISISVVYLILMYANPSAISGLKITLGIFLEYLIAAPAAITIILVPLFSTLSAVRRS